MTMSELKAAKRLVLDYYDAFDHAQPHDLGRVIGKFCSSDHRWRGVHPFREKVGADAAGDAFWGPLLHAFAPMQRRPDVFLAGCNDATIEFGEPDAVWVCQMGHLLGLFDRPWLDIPPTHKMCSVRYVEFHRVDRCEIVETALFTDVLSVMRQAGHFPLPPSTGASVIHPGPATHDGIMLGPQDPATSTATMQLVERMIATLSAANLEPDDRMAPAVLAETWHDDMVWWGPEGIGATYTIDRYQQQHQYPFRFGLADKRFNGHVARFAEGNYACFFGWPNLTSTPRGGFMGLPASTVAADMRVADIYRRQGDKLAENWVFIDLPHWLRMQGLDVLERLRQLLGLEGF